MAKPNPLTIDMNERGPRNLDSVQDLLTGMAAKIGKIYGVHLAVGRREDCLTFVDENGDDIIDPGGVGNAPCAILCATFKEVDPGDFLKLFAARSLYAACTVRFNEAELSI